MIKLNDVLKELESFKPSRSHWGRCVQNDAKDLIQGLIDNGITEVENTALLKESLLNGADNWQHYSKIGNGLCYNYDLAKYYCTPSEFKKWEKAKSGFWEELDLLEVQGRALCQANSLINSVIEGLASMEAINYAYPKAEVIMRDGVLLQTNIKKLSERF